MPKPLTLNGLTILQGERAVVACLSGEFLGLVVASYGGGTIQLYRYEGEAYATLHGSLSKPLADLLEALEGGNVLTNILALEFPQVNMFEENVITREYFVRTDLF